MTKIIRTKSKAHGGITEREKALMDEHAKLWISRAMRTTPIEPDKIIPAIEGLYAAAGLKKPRVVIVPSPLVMAFAYGASSAIWHARKRGKANATDDATYNATRNATYNATDDATYNATANATDDATANATDDATRNATYNATANATHNATDDATDDATYNATYNATANATHNATHNATDDATHNATRNATANATHNATDDATDDATRNATYNATANATYNATANATHNATDDATHNATRNATHNAEELAASACIDLAGPLGIECARYWYNNYQGGNMWAGYDCYLTACRDILGLELREHAAYAHWEQAAIHGGFRVMHEEFCLVSDFPETLLVDDQNLPHCETGPSHRWRDGWSLYHWHGVRVPAHWIESRANLDPTEVLRAENVEQRAAGLAIVGPAKMLDHLPHKIIDSHPDAQCGDLIEISIPGLPESELYLKFECPRNGPMMEAVNKRLLKKRDLHHAHAWHANVPARLFSYPQQRS